MRLTLALLLALPLFACTKQAQAQPPARTPAAPEPFVHPDHTVSFRFTAPAATSVGLSLENVLKPIPMQKDDAGVWTLTTLPLRAEFFSYHFVVDGRSALDPLNPMLAESYLAAGNTFLVPGPDLPGTTDPAPSSGAAPWEHTAAPHGTVHHHSYTTGVVIGLPDNQSDFYVYTPPGYDPRAASKYPVLYLLHGWSDTAAGWTNIGHANDILDNLIVQGKAKPMLVVMPLGYGDMSFLRQGFGVWNHGDLVTHNVTLFAQTLLTEIIPQVERLYNVSARREDRAIAGLSMGGLESLNIGLSHTDQFAWVGGFSAAVHLVKPEEIKLDPKKANLRLVFIGCGTADDLIEPNRRLAAALRANGQAVTTIERTDIAHTWHEWRPDLVLFAAKIFQPN